AGTTRPCGSDLGACKAGSQLCEAGAWAACQDAVHPSLERCNGVDDDCDGKLDEALMRPCGSDVGVCQAGSESCAAGAWVDCSAIGPDPERCNDLDDDCDGVVDESLACRPCEQRITAGWSHTCARDGTGQVWCWGGNSWDELGGPIGAHSSLPVASNVMDSLEIRAGRSHTCARLRSGGVRCWGRDSESQLGDSSLGNLPAVELTLGSGHTCARLITGEVWCWGANSVGELGDGSRTHPRAMPRAVSGLADAAAIKAGIAHTCALLQTGEVRCWGFNPSAQLGNTLPGSTKPVTVAGLGRAVELAASEHDTCALLATGEVWCWGGFYGPVPVAVAGLQDVVEIKAGRQHTCARLLGGELRCWGANYRAQLGDGTTLDRRVPGPVPGVRGAVELTLGWMHTCARLGNGELWCWGSNHQGQLGDGTTTQRTSPVLVQGLRLPACSP
ncbi:MAG: hypothetical protein MJD61_15715, partial [Proteobacteria bacterium]|nr:hypothetical protein [Pseudomonadota bacterium]